MRTITTTIVHNEHQERAVRQEEQILDSVVTQGGGGRGERERGEREGGVRVREGEGDKERQREGGERERGGREREGGRERGRERGERERGGRERGRERERRRERETDIQTDREREERQRERRDREKERQREGERDVQMPKTVVRTDAYTTLNKNVLCNVLATNKNVMLCCLQMIFQYPFHAPITAVAPERSRSFAESASGRLQLNTHAPYVCGFA